MNPHHDQIGNDSVQGVERRSWREREFLWACVVAALVAFLWFADVAHKWWTFQIGTFDHAFYAQSMWLMLRGHFYSTLMQVPILGNHADFILFPMVPLYALVPHPLMPVGLKVILCAATAPLGYATARASGLGRNPSLGLALTLLLTPAMCYSATFEFQPENLTAFFILLVYYAEVVKKRWLFWLAVAATLMCKENMPLLLSAYAVVRVLEHFYLRWRRASSGPPFLPYAFLLAICILYFVGFNYVVRPWLSPVQVNWDSLYAPLGGSLFSVALSPIRDPAAFFTALSQSLQGNLVWATLLPMALLPLLRPQWIIVAGPILAQHLLSDRSSEWTIYHQYAVPLLPLWWVASLEAILWIARLRQQPNTGGAWKMFSRLNPAALPWVCVVLCVVTSFLTEFPQKAYAAHVHPEKAGRLSVSERHAIVDQIPDSSAVVASPPYQSHLAERLKLYSLPYNVKGTHIWSSEPYPPPPDAEHVLADFLDTTTFSLISGYYHLPITHKDGKKTPSSDQLIHKLLRKGEWITAASVNEVSLYRRLADNDPARAQMFMPPSSAAPSPVEVLSGTRLHFAQPRTRTLSGGEKLEIGMVWEFTGERMRFPWAVLTFRRVSDLADGAPALEVPEIYQITRGLCLPQGYDNGQLWRDAWEVDTTVWPVPPGRYQLTLTFQDQVLRAGMMQMQMKGHKPDFQLARLAEVPMGEVVLQ